VKLAIDSAIAGSRPCVLSECDRFLVFTDRKLVREASRCRLKGF
jgi:hypothetical protein